MELVLFLSNLMVPAVIFSIVFYGILKKIPVFDVFTKGVEKGFRTVLHIAPTLIGLMVAVSTLRSSGVLESITSFLKPFGRRLHFPAELIPMALIRLFSSSAATGFLLDIYKVSGPDSLNGLMASIMMSCTEAAFYTMSIYYLSVRIKKTRWTLPGALFTSFSGIFISILLANMMMKLIL
ncbi:MAG: spore maturation protein [Lachnospiraceae bacterium]|nr:spore maturation protein [Lachnospiraceae bacterium]